MSFDRERFMSTTHGHSTTEWESAREWTAQRLRKVARSQGIDTYGELAQEMKKAGLIGVDPHGGALAALLGQVNLLEHEEGRPLISALVVRKSDSSPGPGFWDFAQKLGLDPGSTADAKLAFWSREVERCYAYWSGSH